MLLIIILFLYIETLRGLGKISCSLHEKTDFFGVNMC